MQIEFESDEEAPLIELAAIVPNNETIDPAILATLLSLPIFPYINTDTDEVKEADALFLEAKFSQNAFDIEIPTLQEILKNWKPQLNAPATQHQALFGQPLSQRLLSCYGTNVTSLADYQARFRKLTSDVFKHLNTTNRITRILFASMGSFSVFYALYYAFFIEPSMRTAGNSDDYYQTIDRIQDITKGNSTMLSQCCLELAANLINPIRTQSPLDFCEGHMLRPTLLNPVQETFRFTLHTYHHKVDDDYFTFQVLSLTFTLLLSAMEAALSCLRGNPSFEKQLLPLTTTIGLALTALWLPGFLTWQTYNSPYPTQAACMQLCNGDEPDPSKFDFIDINTPSMILKRIIQPITQLLIVGSIAGLNTLTNSLFNRGISKLQTFKNAVKERIRTNYQATAHPNQMAQLAWDGNEEALGPVVTAAQ